MAIPALHSPLHITNLPSEMIHKIQNEVMNIQGVTGIKSIFNLALSCKTMREHALDQSRLDDIGTKRDIYESCTTDQVLEIANLTTTPELACVAADKLMQDIKNEKIIYGDADFHKCLQSQNGVLKQFTLETALKRIMQSGTSELGINHVLAGIRSQEPEIRAAAEGVLTHWAAQNLIDPLTPGFDGIEMHPNPALSQAMQNCILHNIQAINISRTPPQYALFHLLYSPLPHIQIAYENKFVQLIRSNQYKVNEPVFHVLLQQAPLLLRNTLLAKTKEVINQGTYEIPYLQTQEQTLATDMTIRQYALQSCIKQVREDQKPVNSLASLFFKEHQYTDIKDAAAEAYANFIDQGKLHAEHHEFDALFEHPDAEVRKTLAKTFVQQFYPTADHKYELLNHPVSEVRTVAIKSIIKTPDTLNWILLHNNPEIRNEGIPLLTKSINKGQHDQTLRNILLQNYQIRRIDNACIQRLSKKMVHGFSFKIPTGLNDHGNMIWNTAVNKAFSELENQIDDYSRQVEINLHPLRKETILPDERLLSLTLQKHVDPTVYAKAEHLMATLILKGNFDKNLKDNNQYLNHPSLCIRTAFNQRYSDFINKGEFDSALLDTLKKRFSPYFISHNTTTISGFLSYDKENGLDIHHNDRFIPNQGQIEKAIAKRVSNFIENSRWSTPELHLQSHKSVPQEVQSACDKKLKNIILQKPHKNIAAFPASSRSQSYIHIGLEYYFKPEIMNHQEEEIRAVSHKEALEILTRTLNSGSTREMLQLVRSHNVWSHPNPQAIQRAEDIVKTLVNQKKYNSEDLQLWKEKVSPDLAESLNLNKLLKKSYRNEDFENLFEKMPLPVKIGIAVPLLLGKVIKDKVKN